MARAKRRPQRLVKRRRQPQWHLLLSALVLLGAIAGGILWSRQLAPGPRTETVNHPPAKRPDTPVAFADALHPAIDSVFVSLGIPSNLIEHGETTSVAQYRIGVPRDLPLPMVQVHLRRLATSFGGDLLEGVQTGEGRVRIVCGFDSIATTRLDLRRVRTPRRAGDIGLIVRGVAADRPSGAWRIDQRLTLALAEPPAPSSWPQLRRWAWAAGHHLVDDSAVDLDAAAQKRLRDYLELRSLVTESSPSASYPEPADPERVDPEQVDLGPFVQARIERSLWALAERAADEGQAVGVLDVSPEAVEALTRVLPQLEQRGYRFVAAHRLP